IAEILASHRVPVPSSSELGWWDEGRQIRVGRQVLAPHQAFRALVMPVGDLYEERGRRDIASTLYRTAAFLNLNRPDPDAFFRLVSSYYAQDRPGAEFNRAVDEYEPRLYALSDRFRGDDWCKMVEFH